MSELKAWRQVAVPHTDIRDGKFDSSVFAADLGEVLAGRGAVDYRDATTFFAKTYLTGGLSQLVINVMQRLAGSGKTEPVIQLQTAFGGGKTHTLLTLYHLLKKPNEACKVPDVQKLIHAAGLKQIPAAKVACLVGTAMTPTGSRTFWGEMAFQLDGNREGPMYAIVAESDAKKIAPGTNLLGKLLDQAGPCLILLDEILVYLIKAGGVQTGESTLRGNTLTFLQELTIAVANCPHAVMIATLTSQLAEFMDEGGERAYQSLEKVLGRVEKVRQTVEGAEIYEVIRRRLFESLGDESEHRKAAEAYWKMYRELGEDVPSHCREPSYRDEIVRAYPFHPEMISGLYERWGTIPEFQRTRGVLRLLADVISNLYQAKDNEVLIQNGSVDLGAAAVRGELVKHTGAASVYASVIESDISGRHAKAPEIDRQLGSEYAKENVAEKLARAVFMYSFSGGQQRGADHAAVASRRAQSRDGPALHRRRAGPHGQTPLVSVSRQRPVPFRFAAEPQPDPGGPRGNDPFRAGQGSGFRQGEAQRHDRRCGVPRLSLSRTGRRQFRRRRAAAEPGRARPAARCQGGRFAPETEQFVGQILKQHGKGFRKHANMLVFLAPDQQRSAEVTDAARRLLALRSIDEHKATKAQLTEEQLRRPGWPAEGGGGPAAGVDRHGVPLHPGAGGEEDIAVFRHGHQA